MSEHLEEYQAKLALVAHNDMQSLIVHWELGELFVRYSESVTDIAQAINRSVTFVGDHIKVAQAITSREWLNNVLTERDDITTWSILLDWVRDEGPAQETENDPDAGETYKQKKHRVPTGGLNLTVPAHIVKALADQGCNAREVMTLFWQNVSPMLLITVAYPDRLATMRQNIAEGEAALGAGAPMVTLDKGGNPEGCAA